ncbi:MAG TPA: hypothetical protein DD637_03440 [Verrucomicrobia bacterium]|mgnify:FL=1|nr:hypothetical protein [Verrucomicrobiota bacterium]HCG20172.1 hypothetical protein [Verrucomicrobiota bacterium]
MLPSTYSGATFDSRLVRPGMLFIALKGAKQDGHAYIPQARAAGAAGIVDGYAGLDRAAREKRARLKAKVIAITGSAGKTTTKELLRAFLGSIGKVHATEGNFNNHIGMPVTILNCPDDADFLVLEMGTNHPGEIAHLCRIARPDIGVITNVGTAHIEFFGSQAGIAEEKSTLFAYARDLCVASRTCAQADILRAKSGSRLHEADPAPGWLAPALSAILPGRHNLSNAALAFAVAESLGVRREQALAALSSLRMPGARWRNVDVRGVHFIDDTYNANPDSMTAALKTFAAMETSGRKLAVLGDMFELGADSPRYHGEVLGLARSLGFDAVIVVGSAFPDSAAVRRYPTVASLKVDLPRLFQPGDTVLLKASHGLRLGEILV